jgi:hypothetical protein
MLVILNEVKNFIESIGWKTKILRLMPQNDITTQSPREGDKLEGLFFGRFWDYSLITFGGKKDLVFQFFLF